MTGICKREHSKDMSILAVTMPERRCLPRVRRGEVVPNLDLLRHVLHTEVVVRNRAGTLAALQTLQISSHAPSSHGVARPESSMRRHAWSSVGNARSAPRPFMSGERRVSSTRIRSQVSLLKYVEDRTWSLCGLSSRYASSTFCVCRTVVGSTFGGMWRQPPLWHR